MTRLAPAMVIKSKNGIPGKSVTNVMFLRSRTFRHFRETKPAGVKESQGAKRVDWGKNVLKGGSDESVGHRGGGRRAMRARWIWGSHGTEGRCGSKEAREAKSGQGKEGGKTKERNFRGVRRTFVSRNARQSRKRESSGGITDSPRAR